MSEGSEQHQVRTRDSDFGKERRTAILRLLVKQENRSASFDVVMAFLRRTRFELSPADQVHGDFDALKNYGLIKDEFLDGGLRIVTLTPRGDDAARGRIDVPIVVKGFWEP